MKRVLTIALAIIMVFSLCACGGKEKAEKYCFNCGKGISKDVAFCQYCGTELNGSRGEGTSGLDETSTPSASTPSASTPLANTPSTSTPSTSTPSASTPSANTPSTSTSSTITSHTHSYSKKVTAATCTAKGYSTYTCSCGDTYVSDNTNIISHNYSKYVCTMCGVVDKTHAYEYLMEWVKTNGTSNNGNIEYVFRGKNNPSDCYGLTYSPKNNYLYVWHFDYTTGNSSLTSIFLDNYYYVFSFGGEKIYGYITASSYTKNTSLTYTSSECSILTPEKLLPAAKSSVDVILVYLKDFLSSNKFSITIADLGFKSY